MMKPFNKNVVNLVNQINLTMDMLASAGHIIFYNPVSSKFDSNKNQIITWNNHVSDRNNCGGSFTMLAQYSHILNSGAYHCLLFDGSIIRISFEFENSKLSRHSLLWWPAPFDIDFMNNNEMELSEIYEDFLTDSNWNEKLRMRSPIRIDFSSDDENEIHPQVHMHTQNNETRISVSKYMCFNGFIAYIFYNCYPKLDISKHIKDRLTFKTDSRKFYDKERFKIII